MADSSFDTLQANLTAIRRHDPTLADQLAVAAALDLTWSEAKNGGWTATAPPIAEGGRPTPLASRYDPQGEAAKLLERVDLDKAAGLFLIGLGLGYHLRPALEALGDNALVVVYEPDTALLRAVLERIDLSAELGRRNVLIFAGKVDRAKVLQTTEPHAALLTQGTQLLTLPVTRQRHPEAVNAFGQHVADVVAYCRTNIATALVNAARTCENLASNLDVYAAGASTDALYLAAKGYPAVCVGAGPSLVKNVDLLRDPAVRQNVVLIAVQTALRPLLDRGIRPDFVTALDYSPICARFYEGLPDLPDVTLVAEPKAHCAVLDAYPGPVRLLQSEFNDQLLGDPSRGGMSTPRRRIKGGATVAHLSYYLAQHLGCDPVMFIGQDLGFSDGLYYAPGTAVHQVWDCELNEFNTIETMEWLRIVRMRGHLQRCEDIHGRPIFTDEQMVTYLKQFERDFAEAEAAGQTVIDATEGGVPKEHTTRMGFAEAIAAYATRPVPKLPVPERGLNRAKIDQLDKLMAKRLEQMRELRKMSHECTGLIAQMQRCVQQKDQGKLDRLFTKLDRHRGRVEGDLYEPFQLVSQLNTIGAFRRNRADRMIAKAGGDKVAKLAGQLERDSENIEWIIQACDEAIQIIKKSHERIRRHRLTAVVPARGAARTSKEAAVA